MQHVIFASKFRIMAIIGYIKDSFTVKDIETYLDQMNKLGCQKIYEDDTSVQRQRIWWKYLLENRTEGDTIIIYKLSNALGGWVELPLFLQLCLKKKIRVISIKDGLDTDGHLYTTSLLDFLPILASFGKETYEKKPKFTKDYPLEMSGSIVREQKRREKMLLERTVINDYLSGKPIETICSSRHVPKTTIYRLLDRNGIKTNRCDGSAYSKKRHV